MKIWHFACALAALTCCWAGSDTVAARLAREAHQAQNSGQLVRAYLLYSEAVARDPDNATYRANRDSLASAANLLTKADVEKADVSADIKAAESASPDAEPPVELASREDWARGPDLAPPPALQPNAKIADFDLRGDERKLFSQVADAYGVRVVFDPQFQAGPGAGNLHFEISRADLRIALEALTASTHTFVFPLSPREIFVANDTEQKRNEYEPKVLLTFPLPEALEQKDLVEAANAVRAVLGLRTVGWDSASRTVMIRDRMSRARIARSVLEALLFARAQVSFQVQFLAVDSDVQHHYGLSLPTTFNLADFGKLGGLKSIAPTFAQSLTFLAFGGGASLFGVSVTEASLFATFSKSFTRTFYDATMNVSDGQTASLHVGEKYPIPQSLYTGFQSSNPSIYNPIGQVTLEDLGLVLKLTPHINGDANVALDIEVELKGLGAQTFNTVPAISDREFKGNVTVREGEWAVIAGLDQDSNSITRTGLAGLGQIPGVAQITSENTRDRQSSKTLVVIKPIITRLPMSATISPQYLLGPGRGERVLWAGAPPSSNPELAPGDGASPAASPLAPSPDAEPILLASAGKMPSLPPQAPAPDPIPLWPSAPIIIPPRPVRRSVPDLRGLPPGLLSSPVQLFVKVEISSSGHVTDAQIVGPPNVALAVCGAALSAARQWVFQPATIRGTNAASEHIIRFDFGGRT